MDETTRRIQALTLRHYLDKASGGPANYIICGDLNTMGLDYPYTAHDITPDDEIAELRRRASHHTKDMAVLTKTHEHTWLPNAGSRLKRLDLDHVVAASHLAFTTFGGASVDVRGWPQSGDPHGWAACYSDHALLYFEVA